MAIVRSHTSLRRQLTKVFGSIIGIGLLLFGLSIASSLYRYWSWHPKVWNAVITADGEPSKSSALYLDLHRRDGGVLVRNADGRHEVYAVGLGSKRDWKYVWRCDDFAFSFLPGLAFSNHIQFGQGCTSINILLADDQGRPIGNRKYTLKDIRVETNRIEFVAEDGKRINAAW